MAEVYTVSLQKGGVGKTSLVSNLAGAISKQGKKVLIIDSDAQDNSSIAFGLNPSDFNDTIYDVFMGEKKAEEVIVKINDNLDLLPANDDMGFLEFDLLPNVKKTDNLFQLLKKAVDEIRDQYDYVFIDTPPSIGLVTGNALAATDKVIIPFVPETFGVKGLIKVVDAINNLKKRENPSLTICGVVGMMVDSRTTLHSEMLQSARRYCVENDIQMFETIIPKSIRFANSTAYMGLPATLTDSKNTIVSAYFELMKELIEDGAER